jgi:ATP-binding cassette subfamily B protein
LERERFRYPGSVRPVLEDFDLEIPAGRIVAVVGPNGAGKSTLSKLPCRFYDPETGRVALDGVDLRDLQIEDLRRRITVLFQQPVHYVGAH